jgi:molybdopterin-guanine dinucleotide biosynthesis protein A
MADKVYGLVLAGGRSRRMNSDKGLIDWHGQQQRYYLANLLAKFIPTYISCRHDQAEEIVSQGFNVIEDEPKQIRGPYGALMTALSSHRDVSWLVVACDLPIFNSNSIECLIKSRDPNKIATTYKDENGLPEPLAGIWEPKSLEVLTKLNDEMGIDCPRKALMEIIKQVKLVKPREFNEVMNVNTKDQLAIARKLLNKHAY